MGQVRNATRILLIDDDPADRELARRALDKAGCGEFQIDFAACLAEAESRLQDGHYDVLLLDLGLPESYGMETLEKVRAANDSIPLVVLTDLSDEGKALECLGKGAQDYLLKSDLALDTLSRTIRYAIQRQQLWRQLSSANALLEQRNQELARLCDTAQRFVDNVSHEFRTPLTVITEYVSLLLDSVVGAVELDEEQRRFLNVVADRADDLNTMVDDMLDVSKLEAGLLGTWRKECRLADILRHLCPALESKAAIKGVRLEFEIDEYLPTIYCDGEKLGRVIINLAVNAIKFCGESGQVRIWAEENPACHELVIGVTDNGPGISEADRERIFGRFRQLDTQIRGTCKGFGLGLSIANELVDLNLGEMSLQSRPGEGSTFSFTAPLADPVEVTRRYLSRLRQSATTTNSVAVLRAEIPPQADDDTTNAVDAFLNYVLRPEDLLFRCADHTWVLLVPMIDTRVGSFVARARQMLADSNRNRPGNPLPEIEMLSAGEWPLTDQRRILGCIREIVHEQGAVYV